MSVIGEIVTVDGLVLFILPNDDLLFLLALGEGAERLDGQLRGLVEITFALQVPACSSWLQAVCSESIIEVLVVLLRKLRQEVVLLHLLLLKGWDELPVCALIAVGRRVVQSDEGLADVLLVELALCKDEMCLKTLRTELNAHDGKLVGVLVELHSYKGLGLLLQKRHQIWVVLDLARQQYHSISCPVDCDVAIANVRDYSRVLGSKGQQKLEALVNHSVCDHVLHNLVDHQVDALGGGVLQPAEAMLILADNQILFLVLHHDRVVLRS